MLPVTDVHQRSFLVPMLQYLPLVTHAAIDAINYAE
jgi:hypothetical protein